VSHPPSKSQIERLGERLVQSDEPADADLQALHELLLSRSSTLEVAIARVRDDLQLAPTSRIKNTGTILEKLRRSSGSGLKSMQDLAGMRIVGTFDRLGQDDVSARVCALFANEARAPKIIDRRVVPMHGYAAVHVVVFPDDAPIEIQIRTAWQHEWAELFEKLADLIGRRIRYDEPPQSRWSAEELEAMDPASQSRAPGEDKLRASIVNLARAIANEIAVVELGEINAADNPQLDTDRQTVDNLLTAFRKAVQLLERR
jgi:ppGpp synthetase/RelA/SpoT-type nucleotidyltranferase